MKTLPALLLLFFLSGCVSYYQPEAALEDGVYYAEDDPSYVYNPADYTGVVYYPWASLDYFYFGYRSYPWYGFAYDYPHGYYGHYSPWYFSYYRNPYWRPYQKNCHQYGRCGENDNDDRDAGDDRYAGDRQQNYGNRGDAGEEKASYSHDGKGKMGRAGYPPMQRPVAKTPAGVPGSQGRVVNNKEARKTGKSRVQPVSRSAESITIQPSAADATPNPPTAPASNTSSVHDTRSPAFNAPHQTSSPGYGKSPKRKDRD